jgi:hypothetical protein
MDQIRAAMDSKFCTAWQLPENVHQIVTKLQYSFFILALS